MSIQPKILDRENKNKIKVNNKVIHVEPTITIEWKLVQSAISSTTATGTTQCRVDLFVAPVSWQ